MALFGIYGSHNENLDAVIQNKIGIDTEPNREDYNGLDIYVEDNQISKIQADDGTIFWIWGDIIGFSKDGYESRPLNMEPEEYCMKLYEHYGLDFLNNLNGQYLILYYNNEGNQFGISTDRLGTHPLYYYKNNGYFAFSTNIQILPWVGGIDTGFSDTYVKEYFVFQTVFGENTPLVNVRQVAPATHLSTDNMSTDFISQTYWKPSYSPENKSFEELVHQFTDIFEKVIEDSTHPEKKYGLLLSSGTDSRLILAALSELDRDVTAFHYNEGLNQNAKIARDLATEADVEFRLLRRDTENLPTELRDNAQISNYIGQFHESRARYFSDELSEVDVLISGWLADTFFKGYFAPGVDWQFTTPDEFVSYVTDECQDIGYITNDGPDVKEIISNNLYSDGGNLKFHGIEYESLSDFINSYKFYPVTNQPDYFHYQGLQSINQAYLPFVDNRLLDFHFSISQEHYQNKNLIEEAVKEINPKLDKYTYNPPHLLNKNRRQMSELNYIPLVNLTYPTFNEENIRSLLEVAKLKLMQTLNGRQVSTGAWMNHPRVIENSDFVLNCINRNQEHINNISILEEDEICNLVNNFNGTGKETILLYLLVTFLETPTVQNSKY